MMKIESTPTQLLISQVALALFTEPILNLHVESWVRVNLSKISSEHRPLWQLSTANYEMRTNAKHARRWERQQNLKLLSHLSLRRKYILNWINSMFGRSTSTQIVTPTTVAFISARLKLEAKFRLWLCSWRLIGALIWWADERKLRSEPNCMSKKPDFNFNFNDFSSSKAAQGTGIQFRHCGWGRTFLSMHRTKHPTTQLCIALPVSDFMALSFNDDREEPFPWPLEKSRHVVDMVPARNRNTHHHHQVLPLPELDQRPTAPKSTWKKKEGPTISIWKSTSADIMFVSGWLLTIGSVIVIVINLAKWTQQTFHRSGLDG